MLQGMRNLDLVGEQRRGMARTHLGDIRRLDREIKANKTLIRQAVTGSDTTVTDVYGVGPIVAAFLIGYTGDIGRFASANHYAAYNGTAPDGKQVPPCPTLGKFAKAHNDWYRETLSELLDSLAAGRIKPVVAERIPLAEAARAHELLERSGHTGKVVLVTSA